MTDLICWACKNNDLSSAEKILEEYELKLETIQKEVHEITQESSFNNFHKRR